jgi:uncharacterized cupin superfamily protein
MMAMALTTIFPSAYILPASVVPTSQRVVSPQMSMTEEAAKAAWLARLEAPTWGQGQAVPTAAESIPFVHAPISHFALNQLAPKGSRRSQGSLVDVGEPLDFSRPLVAGAEWNGARSGSWACTEGGWDSPKLRPTTESFLVLDGEGCVTDADGMQHPFGPGDVVVLPKQWSGRWDIYRQIHKVWVVHDHPDVPNAGYGITRAVVASVPSFDQALSPTVYGALHTAPAHVSHTIYDAASRVGFLLSSAGSFSIAPRETAEVFMVVDGVFFLTNLDGSARRCVAGDTIVLPQGWSGSWDVVEPGRSVWVQVGGA